MSITINYQNADGKMVASDKFEIVETSDGGKVDMRMVSDHFSILKARLMPDGVLLASDDNGLSRRTFQEGQEIDITGEPVVMATSTGGLGLGSLSLDEVTMGDDEYAEYEWLQSELKEWYKSEALKGITPKPANAPQDVRMKLRRFNTLKRMIEGPPTPASPRTPTDGFLPATASFEDQYVQNYAASPRSMPALGQPVLQQQMQPIMQQGGLAGLPQPVMVPQSLLQQQMLQQQQQALQQQSLLLQQQAMAVPPLLQTSHSLPQPLPSQQHSFQPTPSPRSGLQRPTHMSSGNNQALSKYTHSDRIVAGQLVERSPFPFQSSVPPASAAEGESAPVWRTAAGSSPRRSSNDKSSVMWQPRPTPVPTAAQTPRQGGEAGDTSTSPPGTQGPQGERKKSKLWSKVGKAAAAVAVATAYTVDKVTR